ncbi:glycosyltransferase [Actinomadura montaniterrae]|uniref:Glycosyltransferase family 1 protein n=1 Tax=Actinomadura montaniterrae TaxID=1803903 RepID=A0A6L3VU09_9ACTN|nr:glycosyltransferase [Actinomadura montaniterrae]KAB2381570.1 glycosyltransferase family 1 protein [Actinomadura montaniterrae]
MRILFTVHAAVSHLRLVVPAAQAAARRGHEVAVASAASMRAETARYGLRFFEAGYDWGENRDTVLALAPTLVTRDQAAYERVLTHDCVLGRPALDMARDLLEVTGSWRPDLVVREGEDMAGYLVAEVLGVPHAGIAGGSTHLLPPDVVRDPLNQLRGELGLPPDPSELTCYRYLLASLLPREYVRDDLVSETLRCYRQTAPERQDERVPGWLAELPAGRPVVYASIGTIAQSMPWQSDEVLTSVVAALGGIECSAIVSVGLDRDLDAFGAVPPHVRLVDSWLPQPRLLPMCDVFVTHGGFSGIREGLTAGVPLLVTPMYDDQPHAAARCAELGVGLSVPGPDATPATIGAAVRTLLSDPAYRDRARAMSRRILASPPMDELVDDLEKLATRR